MKYILNIARIALGLIFLVFGLNGFFVFIPVPQLHPFMELLVSSGYIYLIKGIEVIAGLLLLLNYFVPLALLFLGAIIINISAYHLFLDHRNVEIVPILLILFFILLLNYGINFREIFKKKSKSRWS